MSLCWPLAFPLLPKGEASAKGEVQMPLSHPLWALMAKTTALTFH
ncbi:hypothetical protein [Nostoc sp.]